MRFKFAYWAVLIVIICCFCCFLIFLRGNITQNEFESIVRRSPSDCDQLFSLLEEVSDFDESIRKDVKRNPLLVLDAVVNQSEFQYTMTASSEPGSPPIPKYKLAIFVVDDFWDFSLKAPSYAVFDKELNMLGWKFASQ